ncbi:MAG: DUF1553 domain-containing protein [Gemmataceae bacterium]
MTRTLLVALLLPAFATAAPESLPAGAKLTKLEARPARVAINSPFEYAQVVLTGTLATGERLDVTRMASIQAPGCVKVNDFGLARPVADGAGTIRVSLAGQSLNIPVEVKGQKDKVNASFVQDVMPVLSRLGCNAGTCHGAESGKGGFKLSLRGYDPLFDHRALTDDHAARRINRAAPDASLMLMKPTGAVPHVGQVMTQPGEPYYEIVKAWIGDGVKLDLGTPRVRSIEVFPASATIALPKQKHQLSVVATYADGRTRDVTLEAFLESSNTEVATVDRQAAVTAVRRGETTVMARYEGAYAATTLVVMGDRSGFAWKSAPEYNWIDTLVYEKLRQVKILPSGVCTDGEFIRRVYLDLIGVPPSSADVRAFLADATPSRQKREKLVDRLVGNDDFVEHWTNKWADLLQVNRKFLGEPGAAKFRAWIKQAVASNMPYDQFVRAVLTGSGSNLDNPPASYFKVLRTADAAMENTTQLFLAVRFNCNKCHDHPFERWTQDQYYQLSAFFAQVGRQEDGRYKGQRVGGSAVEGATPLVEVISDQKGGEITHARTGAVTPPEFPYMHKDVAPPMVPRRDQLAKWLTSKDNQYFARSYVNRLWAYLLGVGLIEPIDDIRAGNPPTNPRLLDRLTEEFVNSGFDARHMICLICKSRTYQHSVAANDWNADDQINYSHAVARRLPAEVLYDAIHRATGSMSRLPGLPPGARAAQLLDSTQDAPGGFFVLFGKPPRESACECERVGGVQLGPVLNLVNGPVVGEAVKDPANRITQLLRTEKDTGKVIEELFLSCLARYPTAKEKAEALRAIRESEEFHDVMLAEAKKRKEALDAYEKAVPQRQAAWEAGFSKRPDWRPVEVVELKANSGATMTRQNDGSVLLSGKNNPQDVYTVKVKTPLVGVTAIRLEVLPDKTLPANGPGRAANGNLVLQEFRVGAVEVGKQDKPKPVALAPDTCRRRSRRTGLPWATRSTTTRRPGGPWPEAGKAHRALFQLKEPLKYPAGSELTITMVQRFGLQHTIGKFRLMVTTSKPPLSLGGPPPHLAALAVEPGKRTPQQKAAEGPYQAPGRGTGPAARRGGELPDTGGPAPPRRAGPGVGADQLEGVPVQPLTPPFPGPTVRGVSWRSLTVGPGKRGGGRRCRGAEEDHLERRPDRPQRPPDPRTQLRGAGVRYRPGLRADDGERPPTRPRLLLPPPPATEALEERMRKIEEAITNLSRLQREPAPPPPGQSVMGAAQALVQVGRHLLPPVPLSSGPQPGQAGRLWYFTDMLAGAGGLLHVRRSALPTVVGRADRAPGPAGAVPGQRVVDQVRLLRHRALAVRPQADRAALCYLMYKVVTMEAHYYRQTAPTCRRRCDCGERGMIRLGVNIDHVATVRQAAVPPSPTRSPRPCWPPSAGPTASPSTSARTAATSRTAT